METKKDELFIKNALKKIKKGKATRFLDPKEAYLMESSFKKHKLSYQIYKPFETANSCIFYKEQLPKVSLLKTKNKNFKHSDVMGSYFTLGLDKSVIGDIVLQDNHVYIVVLEEYEQLLIDQFIVIKNEYVTFEKTGWIPLNYQYEEVILIITSNRIDCLVSKLLKLSRNQANELFSKKEVILNYETSTNHTKVKPNDIFSIRKNGKYQIENIEPFKNKYKITLKKYV